MTNEKNASSVLTLTSATPCCSPYGNSYYIFSVTVTIRRASLQAEVQRTVLASHEVTGVIGWRRGGLESANHHIMFLLLPARTTAASVLLVG